MCKKQVATKIYECGDRVTDDFSFTSCGNQDKEGHKVEVSEMGSSKVKGKCGRSDCTKP
ncbi:hypothetical protein GGS24DRAFT_451057 [Hypoxylon argillaceum]|nr:hypothetical protein GGS24DRAFT_451057 [Hypoxylon argillaceum]